MYLRCLKYIICHKWFVFIACCRLGIPWRGIVHDLSKFRPAEFFPYARYFYNSLPITKRIKVDFDKAWLLHIHRNPHHWQFWLLQEDDGPLKKLPIPIKYLKEMLADWNGAGRAQSGKDNTTNWYMKNKHKIKLNNVSRLWIERGLM